MKNLNFGQHRVYIYESPAAVKLAATEHIVKICAARAKLFEKVSIALSGGSTPVGVYQNLVNEEFYQTFLKSNSSSMSFPWAQSLFFFGDERYVPHDDQQSNYRMAKEAFLNTAPIGDDQIHAIPTDCDSAEFCAEQYAQQLSILEQNDGIPMLDYLLLGIGDDGHTASLFPGTSIIDELDKNVAAVYVEKFHSWRISLTFRVLNQARVCCVLAAGEAKASVLLDVMQNKRHDYPVGKIRNQNGLDWFIDQAAASLLDK